MHGLRPTAAFLLRRDVWCILPALAVAIACGGGTPTAPGPPQPPGPPLPFVTVVASPSPFRSTYVGESAGTLLFRVAGDFVLTETAGTGGRLTQLTATLTSVHSTPDSTGTLNVSLSFGNSLSIPLAPLGTATFSHTQQVGVSSTAQSAAFSLLFVGTDTHGRTFQAGSQSFALDLAAARRQGASAAALSPAADASER